MWGVIQFDYGNESWEGRLVKMVDLGLGKVLQVRLRTSDSIIGNVSFIVHSEIRELVLHLPCIFQMLPFLSIYIQPAPFCLLYVCVTLILCPRQDCKFPRAGHLGVTQTDMSEWRQPCLEAGR